MSENIRWKQRFYNFEKAFFQLKEAVEKYKDTTENIIKEGIIQRFEFTHELAWKVLKDYLEYEGIQNIYGSRSATREAFNKKIITNGEIWMKMIDTRNNTVHNYDEEIINQEFEKIIHEYYPALVELYQKISTWI